MSIINILDNEIGTFTPIFKNTGDVFINSDKQCFHQPGDRKKQEEIWFGLNDSISSFTGREKEIELLHSLLMESNILVVNGMGGIGKTELARKYAWQNKDVFYKNIIWLNAETKEYLEESLHKLAIEMNIPVEKQGTNRLVTAVLEDIYQCFLKNNCLLVFDNVIDMGSVKKYLPSKKVKDHKINILITSQNTEWGKTKRFNLEVLSEEDSIALVKDSLEDVCDVENDLDDIIKLVRVLQYLPLALQQAIAYIIDRLTYVNDSYTINDYIVQFEKEDPLLYFLFDGEAFPEYSDNIYNKTVCVTIKMAMENMKNCPHSIISFGILYTVAYLAPDDIPKTIFLPLTKFNNMEELDVAIRNITKFSIMTEHNDKLKIHRLVQQVLRYEFKLIKHYNFLKIALDFVISEEYKDSAHCRSVVKYAQDLGLVQEFYEKCYSSKKNILLYSIGLNGYLKALRDISDPNIYLNENVAFKIIFAATKNGHVQIVNHFINKGATITNQDEKGWSHLHQAAYHGQLHLCKLYVNNGVDVNVLSADGFTPLHFAAQAGHLEIVQFLIQNNAEINIRTDKGWTPFLYSTSGSHFEIMKLLLENNANINDVTNTGFSAIFLAAIKGVIEVMEFLLGKMDAKYFISRNKVSPLHIVSDQGNLECVKFLVEQKFDVNQETDSGITPLRIAIEAGHIEIVKYFDGIGANFKVIDGWSPIHICSYLGHKDLLSYYLEQGESLNSKINGDWSLLHLAVDGNHDAMVAYLIDQGIELNEKNNNGYLPLHYATYFNRLSILKTFIKKGCSIEAKTSDGRTPLHLAAEKGHLGILSYLFDNNVDINETTNKGLTALHLAAEIGHMHVAKLLLDQGCLVDIKTKDGVTPFHLSCFSNNPAIMSFLIENGASINASTSVGFTAIHLAAQKSRVHVLKFLLDKGLDINILSKCEWTPLNIAVLSENVDAAKYLIDQGANINLPTDEGMTPLHVASFKGNLELVQYLISAGAAVNAKNKLENTAVQFSVGSGNLHVLKCLVQNGGIVNSLDHDNDSPLHSAVECDNLEFARYLIDNGANVNYMNLKGETPLALANAKSNKEMIELLESKCDKDPKIIFHTNINRNTNYISTVLGLENLPQVQKNCGEDEDID